MNFRIDHWASQFDDETLWTIYYKIKPMRWVDAAHCLKDEFGSQRIPGKNSIYEFKAAMREEEYEHRKEQIAQAKAEAVAIAKSAEISDEEIVAAYKQLAVDAAFTTRNTEDAARFVGMATAIADRQLKAQELALKKQAQATKDETLRLAREKFEAAEKRLAAVQGVAEDKLLTTEDKLAKIKEIFG